ncbi:DUF4279 domain-containing protein [Uliginosibacterium paludis]|uniref:DUF4279 domain-containing protein n=1 Tax=Uliginosibacterium paludis TaxID=1615952 RepID=A0ABV2CUF6_9RHOO
MGDDLDPDEVSALLQGEATKAHRKGQLIVGSKSTHVANSGVWRLIANESAPENTDTQVDFLLSQLTTNLEIWRDLASRFKIDLFCGWFMKEGNEGVSVSPQTLKALGERGIELAIDIYGPEKDV